MPCGCEKSSWQIPTASGSLAAAARPYKEISALWVEFRCSVDCGEEADHLQWKLTLTSCEPCPALPTCSLTVSEEETAMFSWIVILSQVLGPSNTPWVTVNWEGHTNLILFFFNICSGFLLLHINEMGCEMCAVWVEPASLVVALVGTACIFQRYLCSCFAINYSFKA